MSTTLKATKSSKTQWAQISKTTTLPSAAHVLVHFFVGTVPPRREIAKFHPHIDKVKKPTTTLSFVQFVELEYIYYEFNPWRARLNLTEASSTLIFFLRFRQKNTRIHVAYSNRFRPSLLSQSRRRFRFPLDKR